MRDSFGFGASRLWLALLVVVVATAGAAHPLGVRAEVVGERIVFVSDRGGQFDIYLLDPADPANPTPVTSDAAAEQAPQLSPDGTQVVFAQGGDIWTMGLANPRVKTRVTADERLEVRPTWSPDGSMVAFSRQMGGRRSNFDIVVHTLATGTETLWSSPGDDVDPDWSTKPDLDRPIVFSSLRTGSWQVFRANPSGGDEQQITFSRDPSREPAWSPDASQIAYSQWWRKSGVTLTILDVAGGEASARRIGNGNQDWGATWSPDGQKIAYRHRTVTGRHYVDGLYIVERSPSGWEAPALVPAQEGNSYSPHWGNVIDDDTTPPPPGCDLPLCL